MAAGETWVLDGLALYSGALAIDELNDNPPAPLQEWSRAADSDGEALVRAPKYPNRQITMKLAVLPQVSMAAALDVVGSIQDKLAKAHRTEGGIALVWTPHDSTRSVTFDVLGGHITELPIASEGDGAMWFAYAPVVTLVMDCKPFWRKSSETLTSSASSATPFVTLEVPSVTGDAPALGRLIVTDAATQTRRHVEWGLENEFYVSGAAPSLLIDSDNMVTTGYAGSGGVASGAYDPNASGNNAISSTLAQGVLQSMCSVGNLSHVGVYRVKGRFQATANAQVRLSWQAGDNARTPNPWVPVDLTTFKEYDLGLITIPPTVLGTQRWTGTLDVFCTAGSPVVTVDYLVLIPAGEGYGKARAIWTWQPGLGVARDNFDLDTTGTVLNGATADLGGTWVTSGAATDFTSEVVLDTDKAARRTAVSDGASYRFAVLGATNYTNVEVHADIYIPPWHGLTKNIYQGLIARWVDASNHVRAYMLSSTTSSGSANFLQLETFVAGAVATSVSTPWAPTYGQFIQARLIAWDTGRAMLMLDPPGIAPSGAWGAISIDSSAIATGGALQTGKPGFLDRQSTSGASTRYYNNFDVSTPTPENAVINSTRTAQIRYDDTIRADSTNTYFGRPTSYRGTRFFVPTGTSRVLVKGRRSDIDMYADAAVTDNTTIQVGWTERGLIVPRT